MNVQISGGFPYRLVTWALMHIKSPALSCFITICPSTICLPVVELARRLAGTLYCPRRFISGVTCQWLLWNSKLPLCATIDLGLQFWRHLALSHSYPFLVQMPTTSFNAQLMSISSHWAWDCAVINGQHVLQCPINVHYEPLSVGLRWKASATFQTLPRVLYRRHARERVSDRPQSALLSSL